jgi:hypothetical protein
MIFLNKTNGWSNVAQKVNGDNNLNTEGVQYLRGGGFPDVGTLVNSEILCLPPNLDVFL